MRRRLGGRCCRRGFGGGGSESGESLLGQDAVRLVPPWFAVCTDGGIPIMEFLSGDGEHVANIFAGI